MRYLTKFDTRNEYREHIAKGVSHNVSLVQEDGGIIYYACNHLYVHALEDLTIQFSRNAIEYRVENSTWRTLFAGRATPVIKAGDKVYFRASGLTAEFNYGIGTFSISGSCILGGNVMSMVYGDDYSEKTAMKSNQFRFLFKDCTTITDASRLILPATTLADLCYSSMFKGCTSLVTAPELPATSLVYQCYSYMFEGCTSLVTAPELPATSLVSACYFHMFEGCTSLVTAPELPATSLTHSCYESMFSGCQKLNSIKMRATYISAPSCLSSWVSGVASSGTFVKAAGVEIPTGVSGIPSGWTVEEVTE